MNNVIVVVGPTASGKTKASIGLAKEIQGEIVSADSMQVYKYMDIGTAKPSNEEMDGIKHHLINEITPDTEFSVAKYQQLAYKYIDEILKKDKVPIVCGGTGLYINSLIYNIEFADTVCDWELRRKLEKEAKEYGNEYIYNKLKAIDPKATEKIHKNNVKRVIRAIEVYSCTNKPISLHQEESLKNPPKYNYIVIGLTKERKRLYEDIEKRVDIMIKEGLVEEVKNLIEMGYDKDTIAMQGLGYKEIMSYIKGELSKEESLYILKRDTRRYAKRQITWFKKLKDICWINVDEIKGEKEILEKMKYHIARCGIIL
ncbi:tRNA (adenosine(37)-N6)-dimethylallyltransferase MiaA [Herbivorax sp. ANBcel31]|uniref:tRNA (adenosine(37)-N6)-dimethylallyltransferase MiaA n=1 Tax=Herbivorax sp. ANBcel31 TaxID=3069754 RepID=UPI0027B7B321|nr:tRNA (adenosine(37)-N6)-dimethylallyltransferase MiaA [Herbivorax sp. ANBcel31]MDQ2087009.1 tRNA (adenosine(37)-N6)-dimethylallyltransferase MiaA [Herbivorax sp. ANBcel31]